MYFNNGWRMSPAEESIYWRLDAEGREAFLEDGTSAVELTRAERRALEEEWEEECDWHRQQELIAFLSD